MGVNDGRPSDDYAGHVAAEWIIMAAAHDSFVPLWSILPVLWAERDRILVPRMYGEPLLVQSCDVRARGSRGFIVEAAAAAAEAFRAHQGGVRQAQIDRNKADRRIRGAEAGRTAAVRAALSEATVAAEAFDLGSAGTGRDKSRDVPIRPGAAGGAW